MPTTFQRGNTMTEYGFILVLIALVSLGALSLMGGSLSDLLGGTVRNAVSSEGSASSVMGLLSPVPGSQNAPGGGLQVNPETGLPVTGASVAANGGTNTTSIEGKHFETESEQTLALSDSMKKLAAADPVHADTLRTLSDLIYYMGGLQGGYLEDKQDTVEALQLNGKVKYGSKDAKYELQQFSGQLNSLMSTLPPGSPAYAEAKAIVADVQSIAQGYTGNKLMKVTGNVKKNSYRERASLSNIKRTARTLLEDSSTSSGTEATFADAAQLEGATQAP